MLVNETLELKTTANLLEAGITINFVSESDTNSTQNLTFKCTDLSLSTWTFHLTGCMADGWSSAFTVNGIPNDDIKVWQITRTSTNLVIVCNGVRLMSFNFATDYKDGYSTCQKTWGQFTAIQFTSSDEMYNDTSHLFIRIANNGKCSYII